MRCLFRERLLARGSTASDAIACVHRAHIILAGSLAGPRMSGMQAIRDAHTSVDTIPVHDRARPQCGQHGAIAVCVRRHPASSQLIWRAHVLTALPGSPPQSLMRPSSVLSLLFSPRFSDADASRTRQRTCSAFTLGHCHAATLPAKWARLLRPALLPEDSLPSFSVIHLLLPFVRIATEAIARANHPFSENYVTRRYLGLPGPVWCSSTRTIQEDSSISSERSGIMATSF